MSQVTLPAGYSAQGAAGANGVFELGTAPTAPTQTLSVLEQIMVNIVATLKTVTTSNGYSNTLSVSRPNASGTNPVVDMAAVVLQGEATRDFECPQNLMQWEQKVSVVAMIVNPEGSSASLDTRRNSICADIQLALCQPSSFNRGGLAVDTVMEAPEYETLPATASAGAVAVNFTVKYRTQYNQPYQTP